MYIVPREINHTLPAARQMTDTILAVKDLHRTFRVSQGLFKASALLSAVSGVSLSVKRGSVLGIVGESECGKSTLARLIVGLDTPDSGQIMIDGQTSSSMGRLERARKIQIVFQDPNSSLNPRKTVRSIVTMPLQVHGIGDRRSQHQDVTEMLDLVGLPQRLHDSPPGKLSGGQRQRVAIARALVLKPEIVICDEPTSALDVSIQSQILNLLQDLRDQLGLTYLMISHDLAVIEHMATRVSVMYLGGIVEESESVSLFSAPRHPYTQALLTSVLTPDPGMGIPDIGLGTAYPNPLDIPNGCRFHPRCPVAIEMCKSVEPILVANETKNSVMCHLFSSDRQIRAATASTSN